MDREGLDELMSIDLETRRDAETILFALEQAPDGFNTTTYRQLEAQLGCHVDVAERYLFDLHAAIMLLSEAHGLKLDMSRHDYKEEGLPFVLDYDVWHRKDAAANGMFDDEASPENRDWRDEHDGIIADTIAGILFKALPAHTFGTYDVWETATNGSYLLTDGEPRTFEVRTGGEVVSASTDGTALEFRDQVVRNDLELSKKSEAGNAGLMVPFAIENEATGETHVLVTDRNGDASTASSWNRHSSDTNANDILLGLRDRLLPPTWTPRPASGSRSARTAPRRRSTTRWRPCRTAPTP
jgi:hypothetical protein